MQERKMIVTTEISDDEIRDMDYGKVDSVDDVFAHKDVPVRSNVRLAVGKTVGYRDLDERRSRAARSKPKWLRLISD